MQYLLIVILTLLPICSASSQSINSFLSQESNAPSKDVINVVDKVLMCAEKNDISHNNILTIIDYSLPSSKKRLWVIDLESKKILYHSYVSHGIKSGLLEAEYFSNKPQSKTTSLGVFTTENSYDGRYGLAVKLQGVEKGFNNNAFDRFLVIHPAWYVTEEFIQKYGRLGRSWGCPAISYDLVDPIINTIKDNSLLVVYYPSYKWLSKSEFLTCDKLSLKENIDHVEKMPKSAAEERRGDVVFIDENNNNKFDDSDPVIVISAERYQTIFKKRVPLSRMLRRQYNNAEWISLNNREFKSLDTNGDNVINMYDETGIDAIDFFVAEVYNKDGFWATEFKSVKTKEDKEITSLNTKPTVLRQKGNFIVKSTEKFIRWLGL